MKRFLALSSLLLCFTAALVNPKVAAKFYRRVDGDSNLSDEQKDELQKEIQKANGLKEFTIDGIKVMAINKKNAIRKVNKIKDARFAVQMEPA